MAKNKYPKLPAQAAPPQPVPHAPHAVRETIESIVIAFILAFLFRTFEAEAFVIPTGSMAPTLMGAHKDVDCLKCGHRFRVNASDENSDELRMRQGQMLGPRERQQLQFDLLNSTCEAGMCPNCRYVNPLRPGLNIDALEKTDAGPVATQPKYNGDRILVNKYIYTVSDPQRWDVVVFKFPGNAQMNYIKRLVGLPGETVRVFQGDLLAADKPTPADADFQIQRKPPEVQLAMRQLVHDTDYDAAELFNAGWPLRWQTQGEHSAWKVDAAAEDLTVRQRYSVAAPAGETSWLRYEHLVPTYNDWRAAEAFAVAAKNGGASLPPPGGNARRQLITDFNAYNTRVSQLNLRNNRDLQVDPGKLGLHWVGDLMVEANVEIEEAKGELILDLVEAGKHFTATFDLASGEVSLRAGDVADFKPKAKTALNAPGSYRVAFANFDDQLRLWVDGQLITFDGETTFSAEAVFGGRDKIIPQTSETDPGDFAPVGIGARDTKLVVNRLQVWRDIYYVADRWDRIGHNDPVTDFSHPLDRTLFDLPFDPSLWPRFSERNHADFKLGEDQFFVMGDNSPESSDARLWYTDNPNAPYSPGGSYLERQLLIGKALCVYWPHSWNRLPGTPIPFPLFPNIEDMRLVR